jgi:hypothetical protein
MHRYLVCWLVSEFGEALARGEAQDLFAWCGSFDDLLGSVFVYLISMAPPAYQVLTLCLREFCVCAGIILCRSSLGELALQFPTSVLPVGE